MRCSVRESRGLRPSMFTSTPVSGSKRIRSFKLFESSPILESDHHLFSVPEQLARYQNTDSRQPVSIFKVVGDKKYPLNNRERTFVKQTPHQSHISMVVISDSEDDNVNNEIASLQKQFWDDNVPSVGRKALKDVHNGKNSVSRPLRNRNAVKPVKEEILQSDSRKTIKRVSRVAAIIDEIMNERKSSIVNPSPMIKVKSEDRIDAVIQQAKNERSRRITRSSVLTSKCSSVMREKEHQHPCTSEPNILSDEGNMEMKATEVNGKMKDSTYKEKTNLRTTRKRTKTISTFEEEKENNVQLKKGAELDIVEESSTPIKMKNKNENLRKIVSDNKLSSIEKEPSHNLARLSLKAEPFNDVVPVLYSPSVIEENEWDELSNHKGVFVKKNFQLSGISNGFLKIEKKCLLTLQSSKSMIFNINDGRGIFSYDSCNVKMKIGPGDTLTVPSGFPCKFQNTGIKKNLIISYVKVD